MLRAVTLALHDDAGRVMGHAHGGFSFVYVLTARTAGAINIHAYIGGVDVYIDIVIDFRRDKYRGKRGMTAIAGIERRFSNQAMDAGFGAQPAEGVFTFKADGGAFDAGDIALRFFNQFGFKAFTFAPA